MIFRINKTNDYTVMANYHLKNKNMSLQAKGLLSVMLSLPDDWNYSAQGLKELSSNGLDSVKNVLKELENLNHLVRKPIKIKGKIVDWEYQIYEKPQVEKPQVEKPLEENPIQLNTKELNTKELNTKELKEIIKENLFDVFWEAYPKKVSKGTAERWFNKNKPNKELVKLMVDKIKVLKTTRQWIKNNGEFIPHPTTWLNAKGWEDEIPTNEKPDWFDRKLEENIATDEEIAEMKKMLGEYE